MIMMMIVIIIIFFFFTIVIIIVILENSDGYDGGGKIIKSIWMKKITHLNEQKHISELVCTICPDAL